MDNMHSMIAEENWTPTVEMVVYHDPAEGCFFLDIKLSGPFTQKDLCEISELMKNEQFASSPCDTFTTILTNAAIPIKMTAPLPLEDGEEQAIKIRDNILKIIPHAHIDFKRLGIPYGNEELTLLQTDTFPSIIKYFATIAFIFLALIVFIKGRKNLYKKRKKTEANKAKQKKFNENITKLIEYLFQKEEYSIENKNHHVTVTLPACGIGLNNKNIKAIYTPKKIINALKKGLEDYCAITETNKKQNENTTPEKIIVQFKLAQKNKKNKIDIEKKAKSIIKELETPYRRLIRAANLWRKELKSPSSLSTGKHPDKTDSEKTPDVTITDKMLIIPMPKFQEKLFGEYTIIPGEYENFKKAISEVSLEDITVSYDVDKNMIYIPTDLLIQLIGQYPKKHNDGQEKLKKYLTRVYARLKDTAWIYSEQYASKTQEDSKSKQSETYEEEIAKMTTICKSIWGSKFGNTKCKYDSNTGYVHIWMNQSCTPEKLTYFLHNTKEKKLIDIIKNAYVAHCRASGEEQPPAFTQLASVVKNHDKIVVEMFISIDVLLKISAHLDQTDESKNTEKNSTETGDREQKNRIDATTETKPDQKHTPTVSIIPQESEPQKYNSDTATDVSKNMKDNHTPIKTEEIIIQPKSNQRIKKPKTKNPEYMKMFHDITRVEKKEMHRSKTIKFTEEDIYNIKKCIEKIEALQQRMESYEKNQKNTEASTLARYYMFFSSITTILQLLINCNQNSYASATFNAQDDRNNLWHRQTQIRMGILTQILQEKLPHLKKYLTDLLGAQKSNGNIFLKNHSELNIYFLNDQVYMKNLSFYIDKIIQELPKNYLTGETSSLELDKLNGLDSLKEAIEKHINLIKEDLRNIMRKELEKPHLDWQAIYKETLKVSPSTKKSTSNPSTEEIKLEITRLIICNAALSDFFTCKRTEDFKLYAFLEPHISTGIKENPSSLTGNTTLIFNTTKDKLPETIAKALLDRSSNICSSRLKVILHSNLQDWFFKTLKEQLKSLIISIFSDFCEDPNYPLLKTGYADLPKNIKEAIENIVYPGPMQNAELLPQPEQLKIYLEHLDILHKEDDRHTEACHTLIALIANILTHETANTIAMRYTCPKKEYPLINRIIDAGNEKRHEQKEYDGENIEKIHQLAADILNAKYIKTLCGNAPATTTFKPFWEKPSSSNTPKTEHHASYHHI